MKTYYVAGETYRKPVPKNSLGGGKKICISARRKCSARKGAGVLNGKHLGEKKSTPALTGLHKEKVRL